MEVYNCKGIKGIPIGQQVQRDRAQPPRRVARNEPAEESVAPAPSRRQATRQPSRTQRRAPASEEYDWAKWIWSQNTGG